MFFASQIAHLGPDDGAESSSKDEKSRKSEIVEIRRQKKSKR